MKTAEDVKAFIEYRNSLNSKVRGGVTMFDVKDHYKWLTETELLQYWVYNVYQPTEASPPSDEEIVDFAERVPGLNFDEEEGYIKGATWMRSIASARIAEMEREIQSLKDDIDVLKARLLLND